jgi:hypothetical protein
MQNASFNWGFRLPIDDEDASVSNVEATALEE